MATKIVIMTVFLAIMLSSLSLCFNASAFELSSDEAEAESYYLLNIENDLTFIPTRTWWQIMETLTF